AVITDRRERTGFGENVTSSMTSFAAGGAPSTRRGGLRARVLRLSAADPPGSRTPVGPDAAVREPPEFRPVTSTRTERLTSDDVTTYVRFVAPEMLEELPPLASQRCHCQPNEIGWVPPQTPGFAVSVSPSRRFPAIEGIDVLRGAVARAAITPVFACA